MTFLRYSKDLREFYGFTKVPDASRITRFKQEFTDDLQLFFDSLVDLTEPILQEIDAEKASMSVFDTNGLGIIRAIEFYDKDYFTSHPEIVCYKKTDAPDEDKSVGDTRLLLAGITQLITVVVADRLHKPKYFRSLKRLIA